ncbi:MAG: DedA family protein [Tidjanibacter sp.]|nr:DedA family protein [Tidjanibacter sp.]
MSTDTPNSGAQPAKKGLVRRLYDWILSWAESRWASTAIFLFAMVESIFFPIPPDVLLMALCIGMPRKSFRYALLCTVGSVVGAMVGFGLGAFAWELVDSWFIPSIFSQAAFDNVANLYAEWNFWLVFTAGFTPIPYKLITISAGVCLGLGEFGIFVLASLISRGLRFFLVAGLIWKFGAPIKRFIDKYFNLCAIAFTVLLIGGFVLIKYAL